MPYRRLSPEPGFVPAPVPCKSPAHEPPLAALQPGTWEWTCPACGAKRVFSVVNSEPIPVKATT